MVKKVTYLFGAGASHGALPLNSELGKDMIRLPSYFDYNITGYDIYDHYKKNPYDKGTSEYLLFEIMRLGYLSIEHESIDIYAQAISGNAKELNHLKMVLSVYFTLASYLKRSTLLESTVHSRPIKPIDSRIYNLLTKSIDLPHNSRLINNVNFLTWNYDLQLELAMKKYVETSSFKNSVTLDEVNTHYLKFIPTAIPSLRKQQIWHLNGISGYYEHVESNRKSFISLYDRIIGNQNILDTIKFISKSLDHGSIIFNDIMCFAWEKNPYTQAIRNDLFETINNTEVLVIAGYSFPDRNLDFDREIINHMISSNPQMNIQIHDSTFDKEYFTDRIAIDPVYIKMANHEIINPPGFF